MPVEFVQGGAVTIDVTYNVMFLVVETAIGIQFHTKCILRMKSMNSGPREYFK